MANSQRERVRSMRSDGGRIPVGLAILGAILQMVSGVMSARKSEIPNTVFKRFVADARSAGRPYVIVSAVQNISATDFPTDAPTRRTVEVRTTYVLLCLRDIHENDEVFREGYTGNDATILPWRGTNEETPVVNTYDYNVEISCATGQVATVETGADLIYSLPRTRDLRSIDFQLDRNDINRDYWGYPVDGDYIFDLSMIVQANVPISGLPGGAKRRAANNVTTSEAVTRRSESRSEGAGRTSLVGHWTMLRPNEQVAVQWQFNRIGR